MKLRYLLLMFIGMSFYDMSAMEGNDLIGGNSASKGQQGIKTTVIFGQAPAQERSVYNPIHDDHIVPMLNQLDSGSTVYMDQFCMTDKKVVGAIKQAVKRKVNFDITLNGVFASNKKAAQELTKANAPLTVVKKNKKGDMVPHAKRIIIDGSINGKSYKAVIEGSTNPTFQARFNDEVMFKTEGDEKLVEDHVQSHNDFKKFILARQQALQDNKENKNPNVSPKPNKKKQPAITPEKNKSYDSFSCNLNQVIVDRIKNTPEGEVIDFESLNVSDPEIMRALAECAGKPRIFYERKNTRTMRRLIDQYKDKENIQFFAVSAKKNENASDYRQPAFHRKSVIRGGNNPLVMVPSGNGTEYLDKDFNTLSFFPQNQSLFDRIKEEHDRMIEQGEAINYKDLVLQDQ